MNKTKNAEKNPYRRALAAGGIGTALAAALLLAYALAASRLLLPQDGTGLAGRAILFLAALFAALMACRGGGGSKAARAGLSAAVLLFFVIFAGILAGASRVLNISLLWSALCILCGAAAGAALTMKRRRRRRK